MQSKRQAPQTPAPGPHRPRVEDDELHSFAGKDSTGLEVQGCVIVKEDTKLQRDETTRQPALLGVRYVDQLHPAGLRGRGKINGFDDVFAVQAGCLDGREMHQGQMFGDAIVDRVGMHIAPGLGQLEMNHLLEVASCPLEEFSHRSGIG
jgi:hypothetical protein